MTSLPQTIILEGPDGAGKSTLSEQLHSISPRSTHEVHFGPMKGEKEIGHFFANAFTAQPYKKIIMDRCWMSEAIYAEAYGRFNRMTIVRKRLLERLALTYNTVMIICLPPFSKCAEIFNSRLEEEYLSDTQQLQKVYSRYGAAVLDEPDDKLVSNFDKPHMPYLVYDWTQDGAYQDLLNELAYLQTNIIDFNAASPGSGAWKEGQSTLILGKGIDIFQNNIMHTIFNNLSTFKKVVSITEALEVEGFNEDELYWCNTRTSDNTPRDPHFVRELRPCQILCTDQDSKKWCATNGFRSLPFNDSLT